MNEATVKRLIAQLAEEHGSALRALAVAVGDTYGHRIELAAAVTRQQEKLIADQRHPTAPEWLEGIVEGLFEAENA